MPVSVDISVVVSYNVVVMKILENVSTRFLLSVSDKFTRVGRDTHFCNNLLPISLAHPVNFEFLARISARKNGEPIPNHPFSAVLCG